MANKCMVCGQPEELPVYPQSKAKRELIDGAPYVKGLICHDCDDRERAKHAVL